MPSPKTPLAHIVGSRGVLTTALKKFTGAQKNSRPPNPAGNAVPFIPGLHPLQRAFPKQPHIADDQYAQEHEHAG